MADAIVTHGLRDAGYTFVRHGLAVLTRCTNPAGVGDPVLNSGVIDHARQVNLDDAWMAPMRDRFGKLQASR